MVARVLLIAVAAFTLGCEKADHETIEKWQRTTKGPGKLQKALSDDGLDADLSAHAAANLIKLGDDPAVFAALEAMPAPRREEIVARLAPRLWEIARVEKEKELPDAKQVVGKDALVRVRKWANEPTRQQIDGYLIDWYCVASYQGRAEMGGNLGAAVMRMIGPAAEKRLASVVNGVIAAPGQGKDKNRIHKELLLGLAATGSPEGAAYVLDIARMDRGDPELATRALAALFQTYVDPNGLFAVADPEALAPNVAALVDIARDDARDSQAANAVALIRALGAPRCLAPLVGMVAAPHRNPRFKYVAANNALKCGGVKAIGQVVAALPDAGAYAADQLTGAISGEIARMGPRDQVLAAARALLLEKATISKWVGIETLAAMRSADDVPRIAALSGNRERLVGYWGENAQAKPDPTLGQRAKELSTAPGGK